MDREFEGLLEQYRRAVDEPEPSVNFMPKLWANIEARRSYAFRFRRLTQLVIGAAAAICLLIAGVSTVTTGQPTPQLTGTYLDALAEAHPVDTLAAQGIVRADEAIR